VTVSLKPTAAALEQSLLTRADRRHRSQRLLDILGLPGFVVLSFALVGLVTQWVTFGNPHALREGLLNVPPFRSWDHILGTDQVGRDLLARLIAGARLSFIIAVVPVTVGGLLGLVLGALGGLGPRAVAIVIMRLTDILLAFPSIMLALAVVAVRGPSFSNAVLALTLVFIAPMTRVARGAAVEVASKP
jgi:ABC-type dipeptide/oligopeptide/nickel transport system permease subunit